VEVEMEGRLVCYFLWGFAFVMGWDGGVGFFVFAQHLGWCSLFFLAIEIGESMHFVLFVFCCVAPILYPSMVFVLD
jgi:hypothetical protein